MKNKTYFYTICIFAIFTLLVLPTSSISNNYRYTQDVEKEKKDKMWSGIRQRIGEVYEVRPNKEDPLKFQERTGSQVLEFIVTKKEKFTIIDAFVDSSSSTIASCWLSFAEVRPQSCKIDSSSVLYEIIFDSGKVAYFGVTYFLMDERNVNHRLNLNNVKFVKKQQKDQILKIIQESKKRRQNQQ